VNEPIAVTPDEHARLRAALQGPLRPLDGAERQACLNLAARRLLSKPRGRSWAALRNPSPDFALSRRGWAYLKSHGLRG
jgi:hypothetical protein